VQTPIAWFPGHMAKARRQIEGALRLVDAVIVVVDARAPATSANPDLESLIASRQQFIVLTKADLADPEATEAWLSHFRNRGMVAAAVDLRDGASRHILTRGLLRLRPKGRTPGLKVMVVGTPNVGKSTLINRLAGRATARTGARPGVTRGSQWIHIGGGVRLLDTPGLMWPKLESVEAGLKLAWIGAIGENAYDPEETASALARFLADGHPDLLQGRYRIDPHTAADLLDAIAERRGMLLPGGRPDRLRAAETLLKEFRTGKLGPITLDQPPVSEEGGATS
jgi:ribosome biogenesis GTPase A